MRAIYKELDRKIAAFKKRTGLNCVPGCGQCCDNPNVDATVFELFPLAAAKWRSREAETLLKQLEQDREASICIFYRAPLSKGDKGCCAIYPLRPLICRLYGFSARKDRHGKLEFVSCSVLKKTEPSKISQAQDLVAAGAPVPVMGEYTLRVWSLNPHWGSQKPINEAIGLALERYGLIKEKRMDKTGERARP